jgi:hypothetical protein
MTTIILDDNKINQSGSIFSFDTPYEITINDSEVKNIIFHQGGFILHIDISLTEAQQTLSQFVTNIAEICGLKKTISINNIAVKIDFDTVKLEGSDTGMVRKNPYTLKDGRVDITLDWTNFLIENNNMSVNLSLSAVNIIELKSAEVAAVAEPKNSLMTLLHETSVNTLNNDVAPDLFLTHQPFNVSYHLE